MQLTHHAHGEDWYLSLLPNSSLKKWQALCPESATLLIREARTHCQFCDSSTLVMETMAKWIDQHTSSGDVYEPSAGVTLCRVFTPCAGIQLAAFQPAKCTDWLRVYCGGWSFKRSHSRAVDCRWLGPCPQHYFLFPKTQYWLGASVPLLGRAAICMTCLFRSHQPLLGGSVFIGSICSKSLCAVPSGHCTLTTCSVWWTCGSLISLLHYFVTTMEVLHGICRVLCPITSR